MSDYDKCPKCKEWSWLSMHECPPSWEVFLFPDEDEDEPNTVMSNDSESAALKYVEDNFSDWEHPEDMEIWVRKNENLPWERFDISWEAVPSFYASRKS